MIPSGAHKLFIVAHLLLFALVIAVLLPGVREVRTIVPMMMAIALMEGGYLLLFFRRADGRRSRSAVMVLIWVVLLLWETATTKLDLLHPVLYPLPENVFNVFAEQYRTLVANVISSLELLAVGCTLGMASSVLLGVIVGYNPLLRDTFFPVAQVLTPITPVIYAPYLIALMPTFRSASALVIFCGIFWPTFLNMILRIAGMEPRILDSARMLNVRGRALLWQVLLPYVMPSVISGLKVTLTTSLMMLTFAEMMGATSGMGYYIVNYTHYANYTNVVAGIILVGIVVTILSGIVDAIRKRAIRWQ